MATQDKLQKLLALQELERRGELPEQYAPVIAELRSRGVIPPQAEAPVEPILGSEALGAVMTGAGRGATRLGRGIAGALFTAAGAPEAQRGLMTRDVGESAEYQPVREEFPGAAMAGEALPYFAVPMGAAGAAAGRVAGAVPGVGAGAAGLLGSPVGGSALTGGLMGALDTEGTAAGGAIGGALGAGAGSLVGRAIRPAMQRAGEATQRTMARARELGMQTSAAQETGSRGLALMEAGLRSSPFSAGAFRRMTEANQLQANRIAAEAIGETADEVTSEVLDRAAKRIGDTFESIADEPAIALGDDFFNALVRLEKEFGDSWTESPIARRAIEKALDLASSGSITGRAALDATQRLAKEARRLWRGANADPVAAEALSGIKSALDDAITASVSPARAAALQEARGQWRNLLALERPGVIRAPADVGDVSVAALANAMRQQSPAAFMRGHRTDDLAQLAQLSRALPAPVGTSGTAERLALPLMLGGASVGGGASLMNNPDEWASNALMGAAVPAIGLGLLGRGYASPAAQRYLAQGLLPLTEAGRRVLTGAGGAAGMGMAAQNSR